MLLIEMGKRIGRKGLLDLAAQVAFYLILAFFPFLILLLQLLSYTPLANIDLLLQLNWLLPESTYSMVLLVVEEVTARASLTVVSFSALISIWIASRGMLALENAINLSYGITKKRILPMQLLFSVALTFGLLLSIQIAFIGLVLGQTIGQGLVDYIALPAYFLPLWNGIRYGISLFFLVMVLSVMYWGLPHRRLGPGEVFPGALLTTTGWIVVSLLFAHYVNRFADYSYIYGSLGAVVGLILWLYICAIVFLVGGELNALLLERNMEAKRARPDRVSGEKPEDEDGFGGDNSPLP